MMTATGLVLTLYFAYHCVAGNHGLFALLDMRERKTALAAELELLRSDRAQFEARVDLLNRKHLDPDLLEERARSTLGYAHPDDLVILRPSTPPERAPGL
ncbi:MAG: septum formation initiator family protein [Alphaproteobacteria bacterium]